MVLAAGEGRRLRPLTDATPKALLEVGGVTMLERAIRSLAAAGADGVVVNVFHLAEQVERFLRTKDFGVEVRLSREDVLLDTGGGVLKAAPFLDDGRPCLIRNVDVLSDLDLRALYAAHEAGGALATLAAAGRPSGRRLIFDAEGLLRGREGEAALPAGGAALAFNGIYVLSPAFFPRVSERGIFSILAPLLRLAAAGEPVRAFRADAWRWAEIGTPERLAAARAGPSW